jgi:hypothetical protein
VEACCATGPPLRTVGALDLGGSSLEVTFLPPPGAANLAAADKGASRRPVFPAFVHRASTWWPALRADVSSKQDHLVPCQA